MNGQSRAKILVVDDSNQNRKILESLLEDDFLVMTAADGLEALQLTESEAFDLILLDVVMPGLDGYEVCRLLRARPETAEVPVLFITSLSSSENEAKGFEAGGVDYITKPFSMSTVLARIRIHLELRAARQRLKSENQRLDTLVLERTVELENAREATILSMAAIAELRDVDSRNHILRTRTFMERLAAEVQRRRPDLLTLNEVQTITKASILHDIGKIGIPDYILLKPGPLTPAEFTVMKTHTSIGYEAFVRAGEFAGWSPFLKTAQDIAYSHHERWDGSGYPRGLEGEAIPFAGRLMAVIDVYDALVSRRVYKEPIDHVMALEIIEGEQGHHFDPDLLGVFLDIGGEIREISELNR